nr:MAG TPA: hypothetical protein [Caudoviricetes sp.]
MTQPAASAVTAAPWPVHLERLHLARTEKWSNAMAVQNA